jgi:crotonobetainyl-CoA:carnitine CoA-transferase CaiB-like acyl-CoA transferase
LPLAGHRAVIFGYAAVAPELGWLLAELGAEVIRVESQAHLDLLRTITIEPNAPNAPSRSTMRRADSAASARPASGARARAGPGALRPRRHRRENYRGGVLRGWGLDYEPVRRRRPDVIYLSSPGFGAGGPLARRRHLDR